MSSVIRKIGAGFKSFGRFFLEWWGAFLLGSIFLLVLGGAAFNAFDKSQEARLASEAAARVEAEKVRSAAADLAERARAQAHHQKIAEAYAAEWKKAFLGKLTAVCSTTVNHDPTNRFTVFCHLGEKDELPTKKLTCTELGCDLGSL